MKKNAVKNMSFLLFLLVSFMALFFVKPIPQPLSYHLFADGRAFAGIPNFLNVASNFFFLIVGWIGMRTIWGKGRHNFHLTRLTFFIGIGSVAFGSAYYHWAPNNQTLVWDRLSMTIGLTGLFLALLEKYFDKKWLNALLLPSVLIAVSSVLYWQITDDLRFYFWVQFMPIVGFIFLSILYRTPFKQLRTIYVALFFYALAKFFEFSDRETFEFLHETISGHTIKHVLAAVSCYFAIITVNHLRN